MAKMYELPEEWKRYYDGTGHVGYHYAIPAKYVAHDDRLIACWIVNQQGETHPTFDKLMLHFRNTLTQGQ